MKGNSPRHAIKSCKHREYCNIFEFFITLLLSLVANLPGSSSFGTITASLPALDRWISALPSYFLFLEVRSQNTRRITDGHSISRDRWTDWTGFRVPSPPSSDLHGCNSVSCSPFNSQRPTQPLLPTWKTILTLIVFSVVQQHWWQLNHKWSPAIQSRRSMDLLRTVCHWEGIASCNALL